MIARSFSLFLSTYLRDLNFLSLVEDKRNSTYSLSCQVRTGMMTLPLWLIMSTRLLSLTTRTISQTNYYQRMPKILLNSSVLSVSSTYSLKLSTSAFRITRSLSSRLCLSSATLPLASKRRCFTSSATQVANSVRTSTARSSTR